MKSGPATFGLVSKINITAYFVLHVPNLSRRWIGFVYLSLLRNFNNRFILNSQIIRPILNKFEKGRCIFIHKRWCLLSNILRLCFRWLFFLLSLILVLTRLSFGLSLDDYLKFSFCCFRRVKSVIKMFLSLPDIRSCLSKSMFSVKKAEW